MIAIIDGDVLCYMSCYNSWESILTEIGRWTDEQKIYTLNEDGDKVLVLTPEQERKYLEKSWNTFQIKLQDLLDSVYCTEYLMAVKGSNNYRNLLYSDYKMNRHVKPDKQNMFVPLLRKLAVAQGMAVPSDGCEADDLMRIWAMQAKEAGDDYIICTVDKDLKCIEGKHYLMHIGKKEEDRLITIDHDEALKHYYQQLLKGDPTDNIPGVPRIGNKKAESLLKNCITEHEMQEVVVGAYIEFYDDAWKDYFLSNAKMIHLQRYHGDYFKASEWPILVELL